MDYQGGRRGHYHEEDQDESGGYGGEYGRRGRQEPSDEGGYGQHGSRPNYGGHDQQEGYGGEAGRYNRHDEQLDHQQRRPVQTSQIGDESQQLFKIYCEANPDYLITVKEDTVTLTPGDESNSLQQFFKDCKWGSRVQDESGSPAFAIVHKASGLALQHGSDMSDKVTVKPYDPQTLDESVLWTQSEDVGNGYQCLRPVGNIHLNLDAHHGDRAIRSGTELILFKWKKQENQKWKLFPIDNKPASNVQHGYSGGDQGYGQRAEQGYGHGGSEHGYRRPSYGDY